MSYSVDFVRAAFWGGSKKANVLKSKLLGLTMDKKYEQEIKLIMHSMLLHNNVVAIIIIIITVYLLFKSINNNVLQEVKKNTVNI